MFSDFSPKILRIFAILQTFAECSLLAFFYRDITLIRFRSWGAPIARLFPDPSLKSLFVKRIARLLDFGPERHPSHATSGARLKNIRALAKIGVDDAETEAFSFVFSNFWSH